MPVAKLNNERTLKAIQTKSAQEDYRDLTWTNAGTFGVRVSRGGKKVFFLIYSANGKRRRFKLGEFPVIGLSEAKSRALQTIASVEAGEDPQHDKQAHKLAESVDEIFELYFRHKESRIAATTLRNFKAMYLKDVKPRIGDMKAADVRKAHIVDIVNAIGIERNRPVQSNRCKEMLSAALGYAVDQALIEFNPAFKVKDLGAERVGERYLSTAEIKSYWLNTERMEAIDRVYLRLLLLTGMRPGEVMKLRWSYIDGEVLTLPSDIVKTANVHELYLTTAARCELDLLQSESTGSDCLFPGHGHDGSRKTFRESHQSLLRVMQCPVWTLRDIRRTVETHMRRISISGLAVSEILNHGRDKIRRHYDKNTYFNEKKAALVKWAKWIESAAKDNDKSVVNLNDWLVQRSV